MDDVQSIYQTRFKGLDSYRMRVWERLIRDFFQPFVRPDDTVLDLGAGYCEYINQISCGKKIAMDLNPDTRKRAGKDVEVILHDCSTPWPLQSGSLDVIFTSNFFEHLLDKDTLTRTIGEARRSLKPGGLLIALGPNIKYTPGVYWDFWDHYIPLTENALAEAFEQSGFTIEHAYDKFLPFTMVGSRKYPMFFISLYLKLPFAWRIFGKQFLVIGRAV